jgi:hypothetical protein
MKFEKLIASFLAALMTLLTAASPILAATALGTFPTFLTSTTDTVTSLDAYVVVGKTAMPEDVIAAADIAATLGSSSSYKLGSTTTTSTVTGLTRDGINVCDSSTATTTCNLTYATTGLTAFPAGNLTSTHYSGLKDSVISWEGTDYDFHEQVDVNGVLVRHDLGTSNVNGTEKLQVGTSGAIKYEYVFEKAFNFSSKEATKGTIATPQYSYPYKFKLLGKDFTLVGVGATSIKMLAGSTGTATATKSVDYGGYKFYATIGSTNAMQIDVKDADGNAVETILFTGITSGTLTTKSTTKATPALDVTIISFGTLTDGTVIGCDLVIGPTGTTTKTYDDSADVESTGTANDAFPGAARWGILYHPASGAGDYGIPAGSWIEVKYMPKEAEYYVAGASIPLPNNYATLKFEGWNTNDFAEIRVKTYGSASAYFKTNASSVSAFSESYGFEILDVNSKGSIGGYPTGNWYDKAYILFGKATSAGKYPVAVGFYDKTSGKILVSDSAGGPVDDTGEYKYMVNLTGNPPNLFAYNFTLSYGGVGETPTSGAFRLAFSFDNSTISGAGVTVNNVTLGLGGKPTVFAKFQQVSTGTGATWDTNNAPQFSLGATLGTKDANEIVVTTEGVQQDGAGRSQEVVVDSGYLIQSTSSSTGENALRFKVPSKALGVKVSFGKPAGVTETTGTYKESVVITSPVAVLDSEVTATHKAKNLVVVGGPCVNTVAQSLVDSGKLNANYSCAGGVLGSNWATDVGYIVVVDDGFTTGKVVLFVAGTKAAQTRTAALVLQQYKDLLTGLTGSSYKVIAATTAGITAV